MGMVCVPMVVALFVMMRMAIVRNKLHAFGHVIKLQVRSIVREFLYPCQLKTDVSDAEVSFTLGKVYELSPE